jgi:uncharacterized protein (DUF1919 family)
MIDSFNHKATDVLERLQNIPQNSRILLVATPFAWYISLEFVPSHKYYIVVDRRERSD